METTRFTVYVDCDNCDAEGEADIDNITPSPYDNTRSLHEQAWRKLGKDGWDVTSDGEILCADCMDARRDLDPAIAEQIMEAQS